MKVKSILVSQPEPNKETSPYVKLEQQYKVQIDFKSFIQIDSIEPKEVRAQKIQLSDFNGVVFTNRNAVDYYFSIAQEMRYVVPEDMKYFCQTDSVANYLQKYIVYRKRKVFIGEKDFKDLTTAFKKNKDSKILVPSSDVLKSEVPDLLDLLSIDWKRLILYKTVSSKLKDLVNIHQYDLLVFFTPAGIKSLFDNFEFFEQGTVKIATFGKGTKDTATELGLRVDIEAPNPKTPSMAMALQDYLSKHNK